MVAQEVRSMIAAWMSAWQAFDEPAMRELTARLKTHGLHAYEAGSGLPQIGNWYNGPIRVGMDFLWQGTARCMVTRIIVDRDGENIIWCGEAWNEESRFREAVTLAR